MASPEEQYKDLVIQQTRELSVFEESAERKGVDDLLAELDAAPADALLVTAMGAILYEHTGAVMNGADVSPTDTLRRMVAAAAQI